MVCHRSQNIHEGQSVIVQPQFEPVRCVASYSRSLHPAYVDNNISHPNGHLLLPKARSFEHEWCPVEPHQNSLARHRIDSSTQLGQALVTEEGVTPARHWAAM